MLHTRFLFYPLDTAVAWLQRSCVLGEDTVIGRGTTIGTETNVSASVIGRNCKIGEKVRVHLIPADLIVPPL
jgi:ADP-glucose pyrophosphorylase